MFLSVPHSIGKSQHNPVTQRKKASRPSVPGSLYKFGLITAYLLLSSALSLASLSESTAAIQLHHACAYQTIKETLHHDIYNSLKVND